MSVGEGHEYIWTEEKQGVERNKYGTKENQIAEQSLHELYCHKAQSELIYRTWF